VAAISADGDTNVALYRKLADTITTIYGDIASYHPLRVEQMRLSFDRRGLSHEQRVRTAGQGFFARQGFLAKMLLQNCAGSWLFSHKKDTKAVQWSRYIGDMGESSDVRKFDGVLKMIMDGTEAQCDAAMRYPDAQHRAGRLAYGIHKSREALVKCIVSSYNGNHVHFVDSGDGGYAMAARRLKVQLEGVPMF